MLKKKKYEDMRSCWEFGEAEECRRGLMYGMGYSKEEIDRPLIGVVNSWNEYNPGHVHLDKLAARVKNSLSFLLNDNSIQSAPIDSLALAAFIFKQDIFILCFNIAFAAIMINFTTIFGSNCNFPVKTMQAALKIFL